MKTHNKGTGTGTGNYWSAPEWHFWGEYVNRWESLTGDVGLSREDTRAHVVRSHSGEPWAAPVRMSRETVLIGGRLIHFPAGESGAAVLARLRMPGRVASEGELIERPVIVSPWGGVGPIRRHTSARRIRAATLRIERAAGKVAGKAAFVTARFRVNGAARRDETGDVVRVTDGTGRPIELQGMEEMRLAARAAALIERDLQDATWLSARASGDSVTVRVDRDVFRAASAAAQRELRSGTREATYECAETAARARDRAYRTAAAAWGGDDEPERNEEQPHCAEFLVETATDEGLNPWAILAARRKRARLALAARYAARKPYPRLRADHARDLRSLRALVRAVSAGSFEPLKWSDDTASAQRRGDLARRVQAGIAILTAQAAIEHEGKPRRHSCISHVAAVSRQARGIVALPVGRVETWGDDERRGLIPLASRILARQRATPGEVASLAAWRPAMA